MLNPLSRSYALMCLLLLMSHLLFASTGHGTPMVIGDDGRIYMWGADSSDGWRNDALDEQRTIVRGAYLAPGKHAKQVASSYSLWHAAIELHGNVYVMGYWPEFDVYSSQPADARRIGLPIGRTATSVATALSSWLVTLDDGSIFGWGRLFNDFSGCNGCGAPRTFWLPRDELAKSVFAASTYALVVTRTGKLFAIGDAPGGYASTSPIDPIATATEIPIGPGELVDKAAAGETVAMAIAQSGRLFVWGNSAHGQLGLGGVTATTEPLQVTLPGGHRVVEVSLSEGHAIAIDETGASYAWGDNEYGQLGSGTNVPVSTPTRITRTGEVSLSNPVAIAQASYARTSSGHIFTWGDDFSHHLASGNRRIANTPKPEVFPSPATPVSVIAGSGFTLVLLNNGDVFARGANGAGQLANGDTERKPLGYWVKTQLPPVRQVAASAHGLALAVSGELLTWGPQRPGEPAGLEVTTVQLPAESSVGAVTAGIFFSVAVTTDGRVFSWGWNGNGGLGTGDRVDRASPTQVEFPAGVNVASVSCGHSHCLAASSGGRLFVWGSNNYGAMGLGSNGSTALAPVELLLPSNVSALNVSAGNTLSAVLGTDYKVYYSGLVANRQVQTFTAMPLPGNEAANRVIAGPSHILARSVSSAWFGAGNGGVGELGTGGTATSFNDFIPLNWLSDTVQVSAGYAGTIAITAAGAVVGAGYNSLSEVAGDFRTRSRYEPDCAFDASGRCALGETVSVDVIVNGPGDIKPARTFRVYTNSDVQFEAIAAPGYGAVVSGCAATLSGRTVTTGPVAATCTVNVTFVPVCTVDVDADNAAHATTDGLLLLRALLGLTGQALVSGISTVQPPDAAQALARVQVPAAAMLLDVNGDGRVDPLTDGLIVMRALLGFNGTRLIEGISNANATRTPTEMIGYLRSTCGLQ